MRQSTLLIALVFISLSSCSDVMNKEEAFAFMHDSSVQSLDTLNFKNSEIFRVCRDRGIFNSNHCLFHKKGTDEYREMEHYENGIAWGEFIVLPCQSNRQPIDTGVWMKLNQSFRPENDLEYGFQVQDSIKKLSHNIEKEGLYKFKAGKLHWQGRLGPGCKLPVLDSGLYYLTPPGVFYQSKISISELEAMYD